MLEYGFDVHPIPDGKIHRFRGPEDKNLNGWYVFHGDFGAFGNWRTMGDTHIPWSNRDNLTSTELRELRAKISAAKRKRQREEKARHDEVAEQAAALWEKATLCIGHTYLNRKGVQSHGLRVCGIHLLVPMYQDGKLWSLQKIAPDGTKRFLAGGRVSGCYFPISKPRERLWLAEGYATAATLHEITGDAVACCFNAGNLAKVAQTLRRKLPGVQIIVGADNDKAGLENARQAAAIVDGMLVYPEFDPGDTGTDWNDFASVYGRKFTREAIRAHG